MAWGAGEVGSVACAGPASSTVPSASGPWWERERPQTAARGGHGQLRDEEQTALPLALDKPHIRCWGEMCSLGCMHSLVRMRSPVCPALGPGHSWQQHAVQPTVLPQFCSRCQFPVSVDIGDKTH